LRFGFTNEFMDRGDGWPGLRDRYRLPQTDVAGLDHDLALRALNDGSIDLTDLYSTDAEIAYYGFRVLEDDLGYFPRYDAVFLYRADLERRAPAIVAALAALAGTIAEPRMVEMNRSVKIDQEPESAVAAAFLAETFETEVAAPAVETFAQRQRRLLGEHLFLVVVSLVMAIVVSVPMGIAAARRPRAGQVILAAVGIVQTIPALALLVLLMPLPWPRPDPRPDVMGIGTETAIAALFLYSLLPIVRNTHAGLVGIDPSIRETAEALGLSARARLLRIELPLASRTILAGIKTAAVINVGFATLGALIHAGGYGQPILTGLRLDRLDLILEGALPAAILAVATQLLFELAERAVVPKGLRLPTVV
jgi:osmoprotectant transport system permease protein